MEVKQRRTGRPQLLNHHWSQEESRITFDVSIWRGADLRKSAGMTRRHRPHLGLRLDGWRKATSVAEQDPAPFDNQWHTICLTVIRRSYGYRPLSE